MSNSLLPKGTAVYLGLQPDFSAVYSLATRQKSRHTDPTQKHLKLKYIHVMIHMSDKIFIDTYIAFVLLIVLLVLRRPLLALIV